MANATITPKTDREKALLDLVMKAGEKGVARIDIEDKLKISKPTVEKLIRGVGLKKIRNERRKEFFGLPEGAKVEGMDADTSKASGSQTTAGQSGQYRLPKSGAGQAAAAQGSTTPSGRTATVVVADTGKRLSDEERATLVKIANALLTG